MDCKSGHKSHMQAYLYSIMCKCKFLESSHKCNILNFFIITFYLASEDFKNYFLHMFLQCLSNFRVQQNYRWLGFLISYVWVGLEPVPLEVSRLLMLLEGGPEFTSKNGYAIRFDPHKNAVGCWADVEEEAEA